eukprot:2322683-Pyramimonas_sp.AAC.1
MARKGKARAVGRRNRTRGGWPKPPKVPTDAVGFGRPSRVFKGSRKLPNTSEGFRRFWVVPKRRRTRRRRLSTR